MNFEKLIILLLLFGCGVKSDPIPPVGSVKLISPEALFLNDISPNTSADLESKNATK